MVLEHPIVLEFVSDGKEKKMQRRSRQRGVVQALHVVFLHPHPAPSHATSPK
jgi:hypothetical protein